MLSLITVLMLIVYSFACVGLIFIILIQSGDKGGGLSSLGSANQGISDALGATGVEKTLNKVTTWCACLFILLAIALSYAISAKANSSAKFLDSYRDLPASAASASPSSGTVKSAPAGAAQPASATQAKGASAPESSAPVPGKK